MDFGSVSKKAYSVPDEVEGICFYDENPINGHFLCGSSCGNLEAYLLIKDSVEDTNNNVFLLSGGNSRNLFIEDIKLDCCKFYCSKNENGKVNLILEGKGDSALIS